MATARKAPDPASGPRRQIIVLGMHRSGTSALTGVLHAMGAYVGEEKELTGRSSENPLGFFERIDAREICDALLHEINADWWKLSPLLEQEISSNAQSEAIAALVQKLDSHGTWALKEPRMCLLLPAFEPHLSNPAIVFMTRNPLEVARSLQKRNGFSIEAGLALWEAYNLLALQHSAHMPRVFIDYQALVSTPKETIRHLHDALAKSGVADLAGGDATDAVEAKLHREQVDETALKKALTASQLKLWEALRSGNTQKLSLKIPKQCIEILESFSFGEGEVQHLKAELKKAEIRLQATRDSMRAQENALLHKIEEERARANNLLREVQQREAQIYEMKYSTIWRLSEPLRNIGSKAPWLARLVRLGLRVVAKVVRSLRVHRKIREWWQSREAHRHMEVMRFFRREWYAASEAQRSIKQIWPSLLGYLRQASRSEVAALPPLPTIQRHYPEWNHARETAFLNDIEALYSRDPAAYDAVKISIVMPSWNRGDRICPSIESVLAQTHQNWELFVVDDGSEDNTEEVVTAYAEKDPRIHYQKQERSGVSAARNRGIDAATGEYIFYLDSDNSWLPDYAHRMLVFLKAGKLDAGYAGIEATNDAGKTDFFRGDEFHWQSCFEANYVDLNCFAHHRRLIDNGERFDTSMKRLVDWDFILRLTAFSRTAYAPFLGVSYYNGEGGHRITNTEHQNDLESLKIFLRAKHDPTRHALRNTPQNRPDWGEIRWMLGNRKIAIKIPAPYEKRHEWGDYHYAVSLKNALEGWGNTVDIDFHGQWESRDTDKDEIVIVIRGLTPYQPKPEQFNIMWNISHPDQVPYEEYERFDLICVASLSFAAFLRTVIRKPVATLLQATDTSRFYPRDAKDCVENELLFVGNSRNEYRPIVRWAIESNTAPLSVYGTRWDQFIPTKLVKGENIDNIDLGRYYGGAKAVLNDHWDSMRVYGFVSNRIFDVLAAGGTVISDVCRSISHLFGTQAVRQVANTNETRKALLDISKETATETEKQALAAHIANAHSFDARAIGLMHATYRILGGFYPGKLDDAWMARPFQPQPKPLHVTLICRQATVDSPQSSGYIRLIAPLTHESLAGKVVVDLQFEDTTTLDPATDICIVQRTAFGSEKQVSKLLETVRKQHVKLIVDNDDTFTLMDESHPEHGVYSEWNRYMEMLKKEAAQIWVSTAPLAESYSHLEKPMEVVPNTLDARIWRNFRKSPPLIGQNRKVQMVYMGTSTHDEDFALLLPALDQLAEKYPGSFELTLIGAVAEPPSRPWLFTQTVPRHVKIYPRFVRWLLQQGPFDIGLSPLVESPFNNCKSDIKFLDYCALGILPVVSDVPAYSGDAKTKGLAIMAENTADGWFTALEEACLHIKEHREQVAHAQAYLWEERSTEQAAQQHYALMLKAIKA